MGGENSQNEELLTRLMDLFAATLEHQGGCLDRLELTYSQAKLLWRLEVGDLPSLKELARRCGVDPSNLSTIVDQLTERSLVVSRPAEHDRRVRLIRLTASGVRLRRKLITCLTQHHPALDALSEQRRKELLEILREVA